MAATWHREEPREVRPFFHAVEAEEALDGCGIRLFDGTDPRMETSFDLDEIDFKKLAPALQLTLADTQLWLPAGLAPNDLQLVLVARHAFLKRSELVHSTGLNEVVPNEWVVGPEVLARMGGGRNLELTLAITLRTDREPAPGAPFVAGHWLARKTFLLRSRTMPTLFDLRTRKDEDWVAKGYPPQNLLCRGVYWRYRH